MMKLLRDAVVNDDPCGRAKFDRNPRASHCPKPPGRSEVGVAEPFAPVDRNGNALSTRLDEVQALVVPRGDVVRVRHRAFAVQRDILHRRRYSRTHAVVPEIDSKVQAETGERIPRPPTEQFATD